MVQQLGPWPRPSQFYRGSAESVGIQLRLWFVFPLPLTSKFQLLTSIYIQGLNPSGQILFRWYVHPKVTFSFQSGGAWERGYPCATAMLVGFQMISSLCTYTQYSSVQRQIACVSLQSSCVWCGGGQVPDSSLSRNQKMQNIVGASLSKQLTCI